MDAVNRQKGKSPGKPARIFILPRESYIQWQENANKKLNPYFWSSIPFAILTAITALVKQKQPHMQTPGYRFAVSL